MNQTVARRIEDVLGKSLSEAHLTAASMLVLVILRVSIVLLFNALLPG